MAEAETDKKNVQVVTAQAKELSKQNSVFNADQLNLLWRRTPKKHIFKRPARGGSGEWEYVTGQYVEMYLNALTGHDWSFQVKDFREMNGQVIVLGTLTLNVGAAKNSRRPIIKEQFGRAEIKMLKDKSGPLDIGNDLKAACTDSLKKCASLLGIAWDVYGKDEFNEIDVQKPAPIKGAAKTKEDIAEALKKRKAERADVTIDHDQA